MTRVESQRHRNKSSICLKYSLFLWKVQMFRYTVFAKCICEKFINELKVLTILIMYVYEIDGVLSNEMNKIFS